MALFTVLLFLSLSSVVGQLKEHEKKQLQGKWVLEDASAFKANDTSHNEVDIQSLKIDIYQSLEFVQNLITLEGQNKIQKGEYELNETSLTIDFLSMPFKASWKLKENKLFLQFTLRDSVEKSKIIIVTTVYKQK